VCAESFDPAAVGGAMQDYCEHAVLAAGAAVTDSGLDCAHVAFDRLVADPVATVRAIYKQFDWEFTEVFIVYSIYSVYSVYSIQRITLYRLHRTHRFDSLSLSLTSINNLR
jgi:hypothetical protein